MAPINTNIALIFLPFSLSLSLSLSVFSLLLLFLLQEQVHITGSARNVSVSALSIKSPECHGFLFKQGKGFLSWKRIYCILKVRAIVY